MSEYPNNSLKYRSSLDGTMDKNSKKKSDLKTKKKDLKK